ncbi:MAG: hypothetical protein AB7I35_08815 [Ramlibacter sp.]|nr:hypothetical protein [Ramlibacter sp.]
MCASSAFAQQELPESIVLPPPIVDVASQFASEASVPAPSAPIRRITLRTEVGAVKLTEALIYERRANGLWDVFKQSPTSAVTTSDRMLTARGLVALVEARRMVFAPARAAGALSLLVQGDATVHNQEAVTQQMAGNLSEMLEPKEGVPFAVQTAMDIHGITTGSGRKPSTLQLKRQTDMNCTVGASKSAAALYAGLKGTYLPVSCQLLVNGESKSREYAYLEASHLYLMLTQTDPKVANFNTASEILSVEYLR